MYQHLSHEEIVRVLQQKERTPLESELLDRFAEVVELVSGVAPFIRVIEKWGLVTDTAESMDKKLKLLFSKVNETDTIRKDMAKCQEELETIRVTVELVYNLLAKTAHPTTPGDETCSTH